MVLLMPIMSKSQKHFANQQKYLGAVNGHVEEMYGGHVVMKASQRRNEVCCRFYKENDQLIEAGFKAEFLSGWMMPLLSLIGVSAMCRGLYHGWRYGGCRKDDASGISQALQYVRNFTQPRSSRASSGVSCNGW